MSRKNKSFRAWQHQNPAGSVKDAWDAAWSNQFSCAVSQKHQEKDARIMYLERQLVELQRAAEPFEMLARDKLLNNGNLARPDDCDAFGCDRGVVTLGDCRNLISYFLDLPSPPEGAE